MALQEKTLKVIEAAMLKLHEAGQYELTINDILQQIIADGSVLAPGTIRKYLEYAANNHPSVFTEVGEQRAQTKHSGRIARTFANTKFLESATEPSEESVSKNRVAPKAVTSHTAVELEPKAPPTISIYSPEKPIRFIKEYAAVIGMNDPENLPTYHEGLEVQISALVERTDALAKAQISYAESRQSMQEKLKDVNDGYAAVAAFIKTHTNALGQLKLEAHINNVQKYAEDAYSEYDINMKEAVRVQNQNADQLEELTKKINEINSRLGNLELGKSVGQSATVRNAGEFERGIEKGFAMGIKFALEKMNVGQGFVFQI